MINRRYHLVFLALRPLFRLHARLAFNCRSLPAPRLRPGQPVLILSNHNTSMDPFFLACSFRRPIFFVASDHIFRLGLVSSIIRFLVAPIPIVKSQIDLRTLRTIIKIMKDGGIVGLFPEGNCSFSGITGKISPATGKLVKQLKCTVLLYQFRGGYLSSPRWSRHNRKGRLSGEVVRQLEPDELAAMSAEAVSQVIKETLQVDAFADQRAGRPIRYRGKNLAEFLERALFVCPKCRQLASLQSKADLFSCGCGLQVRYNIYGFFEPVDPWSADRLAQGCFLGTVAAWDAWQRQTLTEMISQSTGIDWSGRQPVFTDADQVLYCCERAARSVRLGTGTLSMYADRLEFSDIRGTSQVFPLSQISRVIVHGPQTLQFTAAKDQVYEIRCRQPRSAYKYVTLFNLLEQNSKGEGHGFFGF